ncbi:hypothetical protein KIPB_006178 [Kipferlia bialata]|uniref:Uncharacterized protein n=1 Tax=Kipferlia bialata TaxID=797122 RepID=A0A391NPK1_9EUKA|nr:hypothetical protein KIPB_006178 [Kipferlia bialata]|eukprot:g6178.t1
MSEFEKHSWHLSTAAHDGIAAIAFSPDERGEYVLVARSKCRVDLYSCYNDFMWLQSYYVDPDFDIQCATWAISPSGIRFFVVSGLSGQMVAFNLASPAPAHISPSYASAVQDLVCSEAGDTVYAACSDGQVRAFEISEDLSLSLLATFSHIPEPLVSLAVSEEGSVATGTTKVYMHTHTLSPLT